MLNAGHTAAWIWEAFQALLWLFTLSRVKTKPVCAPWLMTHAAPLAHWLREVLWRFELKGFPRCATALHWLRGVWFIIWSLFSHFLCRVPTFWFMFSSVCYEFTETSLQWWLSSLRGSAGSVKLFSGLVLQTNAITDTHTGRARCSWSGWWDKRCHSDSRSGSTAAPERCKQTFQLQ